MSARVPPGPGGDPLIGCLREYSRDPLGFVVRCHEEYGDVVRVPFPAFPASYFLFRPEHIEHVLVRNHRNFTKSADARRALEFLGSGLLTAERDSWLRQRRLIQPAFHRERINSYASTMVEYAEQMLSTWRDGEVRNVHADMMDLTFRIVARALFSADVSGEADEVADALGVIMQVFAAGGNWLTFIFPEWLPIPRNLRFHAAERRLDEVVYRIIERRRREGDSGDLLSTLLRVRDEHGAGMNDEQVRDEVMTLALAGHETTAIALTWTWYLLAQHPEVEAKLLRELDEVLGEGSPTAGDVPRLRYTDMVIKESVRLYPPAWAQGREAVGDCEIGGYHIPAGSQLFVFQYVTHRDRRYYSHPERFDPGRWASEGTGGLPRYAYFPFGGGPRMCIGSSFATMEATLLLATIARRFHMDLVPGQKIGLEPSITLRPKHGIQVHLRRRAARTAREEGALRARPAG